MSFTIGLVIAVMVATQVINGATLMYHKREDVDAINFDLVGRKDNPVYFWVMIAIQLIIALILLAKVVQFED